MNNDPRPTAPKPHPLLVDWLGGDPQGELAKPEPRRPHVVEVDKPGVRKGKK